MSWSDDLPDENTDGITRSSDVTRNWAADTDPVGPVTPELAMVDPALAKNDVESEVGMSSIQFGDPMSFQAAEPSAAPADALTPPPLQPEPLPTPTPTPTPGVPVEDMRDVPLGTLVFRAGLLPEEQLEEALQEGMRTGKRLGEILLERGLVSETDLGRLLAAQKGLPFVELDPAAVDPTAPGLLSQEKARLHGALPIGFRDGIPVVAVADPSNDLVVENVRRALGCEPHFVVVGRDVLFAAIAEAYGTVAPAPEAAAPSVAPAAVAPEPQPMPTAPVAPPEAFTPPEAPTPPTTETLTPVEAPPAAAQPGNGDGLWLGPQPTTTPVRAETAEPTTAGPPAWPPTPTAAAATPSVPPVEATQPLPESPAPTTPVTPLEPVLQAPTPVETQVETQVMWTVFLRLADGERLEVGAFGSETQAKEHALHLIHELSASTGWPFCGGRFIRPDAIVSIDLVGQQSSRWLGSSTRAAWGAQQ